MIEWKAADPTASTFGGTRREVLRIGFADTIHGIQQIGFNPTSQPGDHDYGLLYIAAGDGGVVGEGSPGKVTNVPQDLRVPQGKILRIDPRGTNGPTETTGSRPTIPLWVSRAPRLEKSTPLACVIPSASAGIRAKVIGCFWRTSASGTSNRSMKCVPETTLDGVNGRAHLCLRLANPPVGSFPAYR